MKIDAKLLIVSLLVSNLTTVLVFTKMHRCANPETAKSRIATGSNQYDSILRRANNGDIEAISQLASNLKQRGDIEGSQRFWKMGANYGDAQCMNNYAVGNIFYVAVPALEESREWASKAVSKGLLSGNYASDISSEAIRVIYSIKKEIPKVGVKADNP
jgi:hypothetical protein